MAEANKLMCHLLTVVIFFCLVCCKSSAARPLIDLNPRNLAAADPAFNTVVPVKEKVGGTWTTVASEELDVHASPCEMEATGKLGGIYGSLVMNALPKGRTPASGPSRRNNDINI